MKKILTLIASSTLLLSGCKDTNNKKSDVENEPEKKIEKVEEVQDDLEIGPKEKLEKIGQYNYTEQGRSELIDIFTGGEEIPLTDDLKIIFENIKIIHLTEAAEEDFGNELLNVNEEAYLLQVLYEIENSTDQTTGGIEAESIVTSDGNQYTLYQDGYPVDESSHQVRPNAKTLVGLIFKIEDQNIDHLTLYFDMYDEEGHDIEIPAIELNLSDGEIE